MAFPEIYKVKTDVGTYIPEDKLANVIAKVTQRIDKILAAERKGKETIAVERENYIIEVSLARQLTITLPFGTTDKEMVKINKAIKEEVMVAQIELPPEPKITELLLHGDAFPFVDSSLTPKTVTNDGGVTLDTDNKKFGAGSMLFNGSSCSLTVPNSIDFAFGTDDFTIDFWVKFNSSRTYYMLVDRALGDLRFFYNAGAAGFAVNTNEPDGAFQCELAIDTWYHIALVRYQNTIVVYVNGTAIGSRYDGLDLSNTAPLAIGNNFNLGGDNPLDGNIDELRVVKGIAMWTENFTPPTSAYTG